MRLVVVLVVVDVREVVDEDVVVVLVVVVDLDVVVVGRVVVVVVVITVVEVVATTAADFKSVVVDVVGDPSLLADSKGRASAS